jgi:hypothetical protein
MKDDTEYYLHGKGFSDMAANKGLKLEIIVRQSVMYCHGSALLFSRFPTTYPGGVLAGPPWVQSFRTPDGPGIGLISGGQGPDPEFAVALPSQRYGIEDLAPPLLLRILFADSS